MRKQKPVPRQEAAASEALTALKAAVCQANHDLAVAGLAALGWGHVSGIDRARGQVVLPPRGGRPGQLQPKDLVVLDLARGQPCEAGPAPVPEAATHCHLYQQFPHLGGIAHAGGSYATSWAQAGCALPCLGATHATHFDGTIPITDASVPEMAPDAWAENIGRCIADCLFLGEYDPMQMPGVLVAGKGPFTWGVTPAAAVVHARTLEAAAQLALHTYLINPLAQPLSPRLRDQYFAGQRRPDAPSRMPAHPQ